MPSSTGSLSGMSFKCSAAKSDSIFGVILCTRDQSRGHSAHHLRRVDEDGQEDAGDEDDQEDVEQGAVETHGG